MLRIAAGQVARVGLLYSPRQVGSAMSKSVKHRWGRIAEPRSAGGIISALVPRPRVAWPRVVGPDLAASSAPVDVRGRVLRVVSANAAVCDELTCRAAHVVATWNVLARASGASSIDEITVWVSRDPWQPRAAVRSTEGRRARPYRPAVDEESVARAREEMRKVVDDGLREALVRARARSLSAEASGRGTDAVRRSE